MEGMAHAATTNSAYIPTMKDMMSIQTAMQHYHAGLEKHDNRLMASAFSEDGTLILEAPDTRLQVSGRDQIASKGLMPPSPSPSGTPATDGQAPVNSGVQGGTPSSGGPPPDIWHFSTNDFYEFESPTRAKHYGYWLDVVPGAGREVTVGGPGHYEDILVKRNGEWLFLERKIIVGRK
jgi:hypothetical protein